MGKNYLNPRIVRGFRISEEKLSFLFSNIREKDKRVFSNLLKSKFMDIIKEAEPSFVYKEVCDVIKATSNKQLAFSSLKEALSSLLKDVFRNSFDKHPYFDFDNLRGEGKRILNSSAILLARFPLKIDKVLVFSLLLFLAENRLYFHFSKICEGQLRIKNIKREEIRDFLNYLTNLEKLKNGESLVEEELKNLRIGE